MITQQPKMYMLKQLNIYSGLQYTLYYNNANGHTHVYTHILLNSTLEILLALDVNGHYQ